MPTVGYNGIGASSAASDFNWQHSATVYTASRYVAVSGDEITEIAAYGDGTGNPILGLYTYSGGVPVTLIDSATVPVGAGAGWHTATVSWPLTAGVEYCVAMRWAPDADSWNIRYDAAGGGSSTCTVGGGAGLQATWVEASTDASRASFYATVTSASSAPSAPAEIRAVAENDGASLVWPVPADGGSAITDYLIEQNVNSGGWTTITHSASTNAFYHVTGLTTSDTVIFRVSAINAIGTSSASPVSRTVTVLGIRSIAHAFTALLGRFTYNLRWRWRSNTLGPNNVLQPKVRLITGTGAEGTMWDSAGAALAIDYLWASAVPAVTGTIAVTTDASTLAASGTRSIPAVTGTIAVSTTASTLAASGTSTPPTFTGTLTATTDASTLAASGSFTAFGISGTIAVTTDASTMAASGTRTIPDVTGTIAVSTTAASLAASGTFTPSGISGTLAVTTDASTLAASGAHTPPPITGTIAISTAASSLAASGTSFGPGFNGTINISTTAATLAASGTTSAPVFTGTIAVTTDAAGLVAGGTFTPPPITGTIAISTTSATLVAVGLNGGSVPPLTPPFGASIVGVRSGTTINTVTSSTVILVPRTLTDLTTSQGET